MRTASTIMALVVIIILPLAGVRVCCQTVAIGHVTAEIIESVSVASKDIMDLELATNTKGDSNPSLQPQLASKTLGSGSITFYSGNDITCNIIINRASPSNLAGNAFTYEPVLNNNKDSSSAKTDGAPIIQPAGRANVAGNQSSEPSQGSYTVVFAYN